MRKFIIATTTAQAILFCKNMGWNPYAVPIALKREHLLGYDLYSYEVWWLDRMWPCRTHEDVKDVEELMAYAKIRGADIRRWYT
jgi:hypothetical protein